MAFVNPFVQNYGKIIARIFPPCNAFEQFIAGFKKRRAHVFTSSAFYVEDLPGPGVSARSGNTGPILFSERRADMDYAKISQMQDVAAIPASSRMEQEMDDILDKLLLNCVSPEEREDISKVITNERFHYIGPHHDRPLTKRLWTLAQAIQSRLVLNVRYRT